MRLLALSAPLAILLLLVFSSAALSTEVIGHRGAARYAPENTIASLQTAWKMGVDGAEVDVHMTADGKIAVIHDDNLKRTAGVDRKVSEVLSSELASFDAGSFKGPKFAGERIPLLSEAMATVPPGKKFFIEIKCGENALPEIARVIAASGVSDRVVVISFYYDVLKKFKAMMPSVRACWIIDHQGPGEELEKDFFYVSGGADEAEAIKMCRLAGFDGIDMNFRLATASFVEKIHDAGMVAYVWTVDKPLTARVLKEFGVDGITTNAPDIIVEEVRN